MEKQKKAAVPLKKLTALPDLLVDYNLFHLTDVGHL